MLGKDKCNIPSRILVKLSNPSKGTRIVVLNYTAYEPCNQLSLSPLAPPIIVPKDDAQDAQEAAQEDARLRAEAVAEIEEERVTQIAAVVDGADPKKEAARIRERHIRDAVSTAYRRILLSWNAQVTFAMLGSKCMCEETRVVGCSCNRKFFRRDLMG